jgi:ribosomal protein L40E
MMMKCQNCGHENQLGAIFCRGCGGKLDTEQLRPKVEQSKSEVNVGAIVSKIISFVIFLAIAGLIAMLVYPDNLSEYPNLSGENAIKTVKVKCEAILKKAEQGFGSDSYTLTPQEATYFYNEILAKPAPASDKAPAAAAATQTVPDASIEKIVFNIDSVGFVHIILKTKLFGSMPATFEMKGTVVNAEKKEEGKPSITFNATDFKMGHMPVMFVNNLVSDKFMPALTGKKIEQMLKAIVKVEVNDVKSFVVKF